MTAVTRPTNYVPVLPVVSETAGNVPDVADLFDHELAIQLEDKQAYLKDSNGDLKGLLPGYGRSSDAFIGELDPATAVLPAANAGSYFIAAGTGSIDSLDVVSGYAYRCDVDDTPVSTAANWSRYEQQDSKLEVDTIADLDSLALPDGYNDVITVKGNASQPSSTYLVQRLNGVNQSIERQLTIINRKTRLTARSLGITESTTDTRFELNKYLAHVTELGGAEIIFDNGTYRWVSTLNMVENMHIVAGGDEVVFKLGSNTGRLLRTSNDNCSVTGPLTIDFAQFGTTTGIEVLDNVSGFLVDGVRFTDSAIAADKAVNGGLSDLLKDIGPACVSVRAATDVEIANIHSENVGSSVYWRGNAGNTQGSVRGIQRNTRLESPASLAFLSQINWHTEDLLLENVYMGEYPSNVEGGHAISFQGEGNGPTLNTSIKRTKIKGVTIQGRAGVGWQQGVENGAHGDMIAVRCAEDTVIDDYYLCDGGEFGIDDVHGATGTQIKSGAIKRMDGSAIVVGGVNGDPSRNCTISGAKIIDCGIDNAQTPLGFSSISGIRLWNAENPTICGNVVENSNGAGVYVTNNALGQDVISLYAADNALRNNGTQTLGGSGYWSGGDPAYLWDGTNLTNGSGTSTQTWTGRISGVASVNGDGGVG